MYNNTSVVEAIETFYLIHYLFSKIFIFYVLILNCKSRHKTEIDKKKQFRNIYEVKNILTRHNIIK